MNVDVIVLGAGAAGLACGSSSALRGLSVVVLEARDRIGGRILTVRPPGELPVEAGAQVVHGERAATWEVLREGKLRAEPLRKDVPFAMVVGGRRLEPRDLVEAGVAPPWSVEEQLGAPGVADRPVAELLEGTSPLVRQLALAWLTQVWCADPERLSAAGMRAVRAAWEVGREDFEVADGYDLVARRLAAELDVRVGAPVGTLRWRAGMVTAEAKAGEWTAGAAVVTVPPSAVTEGALRFAPPLPPAKEAACAALPAGDALTLVATWSEPATRSGWALVADEPGGFWRVRKGSRTVQGSVKGPGARVADQLASSAPWIEETAGLAFPWLSGRCIDVGLADWGSDAYARGGYCYPAAGSLPAQLVWAEPIAGTLFFAGDATTGARHAATVHGAIESGRRAASEVAASLARGPSDRH
jgi:monoamine oxidase